LIRNLACILVLAQTGCSTNFDLSGRAFACRQAKDCAEGFFCHPFDFVCVLDGTEVDASVRRMFQDQDGATGTDVDTATTTDAGVPPNDDGGANGPVIGDPCDPTNPCRVGTCEDGVCCTQPCPGTCMRCDIDPGRCAPIADGEDPDTECDGQDYNCAEVLWGLDGTRCIACPAERVTEGACDGRGSCRPVNCTCEMPGEKVSNCLSALCLRSQACPRFAPVDAYDSSAELCGVGDACSADGCCSEQGACCPAPMCIGEPDMCR
jgi:hypothetical protein